MPPSTPAPKVVHERSGPLHAEIVTVGRELLRGRQRDDNAVYLASALAQRGAIIHRLTTVDDSDRAVAGAVGEALARGAHLVVTTGGLGPTLDDCTLAGISDAVRLPLALSTPAKEMVEKAYARLRSSRQVDRGGLSASREKMCSIPVGAEPIENPEGVAPGVLIRMTGQGVVLCLPGIPEEMQATFTNALARLKDFFPAGTSARREIETPTADESALRPWLDRVSSEYPSVWIKTYPPGFRKRNALVIVALETFAPNRREADALVDGAMRRLLSLAGGGR